MSGENAPRAGVVFKPELTPAALRKFTAVMRANNGIIGCVKRDTSVTNYRNGVYKMTEKIQRCEHCGKPIKDRNTTWQKYCSLRCRVAAFRKKNKPATASK